MKRLRNPAIRCLPEGLSLSFGRTAIFLCLLALSLNTPVYSQQQNDTIFVRLKRAARVREEIAGDSRTTGVANQGQRFRMVDYTADAFQIVYKEGQPEVLGWVDRVNAERIVEGRSAGSAIGSHAQSIVIVAGVIVGLALLVWLLFFFSRRASARAASKVISNKELVIVAGSLKEIRYSLTNSTAPIDRCLSEVGYAVVRLKNQQAFEQRLKHHAPDIVLVDWDTSPGIADELEISLAAQESTQNVPVIYYNVPQNIPASRHPRIRNVYYFGSELSDRDLFKVIQPHALGIKQSSIVRKGNDNSAVEGDITEGSLGAVLQFIEIGQKHGCLYIRHNEQPFGMIFFEMGNPYYAATRTQKGEKAIYEILDLTSGQFGFAADKKAPERNCQIATMGVLMEWTRVKDEGSRA